MMTTPVQSAIFLAALQAAENVDVRAIIDLDNALCDIIERRIEDEEEDEEEENDEDN
jgi:hypothetical protein